MAKRRMFLAEILKSDDFYSLPPASQTLYIHLNLEADDDGFVGNPLKILRSLGLTRPKLDILIKMGYLIKFDSGIIVITHWNLHNRVRRDRYTQTRFINEFSMLKIENYLYVKKEESQTGQAISVFFDNHSAPQGSIVENSLGQFSSGELIYPQGSRGEDSEEFSTQNCGKLENDSKDDDFTESDKEESSYQKSLSKDKLLDYINFLKNVKKYFEENSNIIEYKRFVAYNEKREWIGKNNECVIDNYKEYASWWINKKKEFFGD